MADVSTFVKLDRNIVKWRWFRNPKTLQLFIYLIVSANIDDYGFEGITIHRGQLATSAKSLSLATGLTIQEVKTALGRLKATKEITSTAYPKFSVISILCYDKYQKYQPANQPANNHQATNKQPASNHNQRNRESIKNGRNKDNPASRPLKWVTDDHGIGRWEYDD